MLGLPVEGEDLLQRSKKYQKWIITGLVFLSLIVAFFSTNGYNYYRILTTSLDQPSKCPLYEKLVPSTFGDQIAYQIINDASFREASIEKLSGAVQVDTQIFDNPPDVDEHPEAYKGFVKFHAYLKETFPAIFEKLQVDYVNTYGLVFTWKGSNKHLKPLLLMAHQDTVPVQKDTVDQWTYPPLSGKYHDGFIYGRGSSDCKNVLIAILESIDLLLKSDFKPERTILAGFGFDEESSGRHGAAHISKFLEDKYGKNSLYAIIDEGVGLMPNPGTGRIMALPGTGEKGYMDITVNLTRAGGHSSLPPDHTAIGIMAQLVNEIERDPYHAALSEKNPFLHHLQCMAVYDTGLSSTVRKVILNADTLKLANEKLVENLSKDLLTKYMLKTSQAIDIIKGGEKNNALPEQVSVAVNHRISVDSSVKSVRERFVHRVTEIAKLYDIEVIAFGETVHEGKTGQFTVDSGPSLNPAPVSPINDVQWEYLAGTVRHVFEDLVFTDLSYPIITAPSLIPANTDTRYYWNLSKHIYRFSPFFSENPLTESRIHSVDERIRFDAHLELLAFFYQYIQNINTERAG